MKRGYTVRQVRESNSVWVTIGVYLWTDYQDIVAEAHRTGVLRDEKELSAELSISLLTCTFFIYASCRRRRVPDRATQSSSTTQQIVEVITFLDLG